MGDRHAEQGDQADLSRTRYSSINALVGRSTERHTGPLRHSRRQEGPMRAIIVVAIVVAVVALLFVVNARLKRRNPELEDYPRKPDGADDVWWGGGGPGT
jgi:hypothetical protein